ncbi:uncharacterized membrane protein YhaH (DUF805 family) [Xenorhabdus cabanillasii]|uniref:Uncharacterized membrane protein YhaH (DUF805 family) n=1 Tax=Xenorhabdus cabanillasii TaxID=351673 RepID=A0A3D9UGI9_9GAMM|nr:DUF805 domain-containing protein [Xenorhabdus cabanillasii]REF25795.1 uncharacterized membrane protein YhaH (DUF805 family) [Xenorhabdus cabanillasii]
MNWYFQVFKNYADFSGRASRKEYWMFYLFNIIIFFAICILGAIIGNTIGSIVMLIYALVAFIPFLAVTVRRLHDTNRSGWWFLLVFVPIGGIVVFIFTLLEGTEGSNDYGTDPKAMR